MHLTFGIETIHMETFMNCFFNEYSVMVTSVLDSPSAEIEAEARLLHTMAAVEPSDVLGVLKAALSEFCLPRPRGVENGETTDTAVICRQSFRTVRKAICALPSDHVDLTQCLIKIVDQFLLAMIRYRNVGTLDRDGEISLTDSRGAAINVVAAVRRQMREHLASEDLASSLSPFLTPSIRGTAIRDAVGRAWANFTAKSKHTR
jgi:hypothetical protein